MSPVRVIISIEYSLSPAKWLYGAHIQNSNICYCCYAAYECGTEIDSLWRYHIMMYVCVCIERIICLKKMSRSCLLVRFKVVAIYDMHICLYVCTMDLINSIVLDRQNTSLLNLFFLHERVYMHACVHAPCVYMCQYSTLNSPLPHHYIIITLV